MTRRKNVIAVMSPKGGVGKTATVANLAAALALIHNKKILAIDTNVSTASLGLHFDIFYPEHTIHDALEKNALDKSIHVYHQNLHLIPATMRIRKKDKNIKKMRENLHKAISNYERILENLSNDYDLILLDCSPGFDLETIAALHVAGGMIIVTNPDYPSIVTAARAIEYAKGLKMPVGGIVLNKVCGKRYELKREDIERALNVKVIGEVPFDKRIPESIAKKKPAVLYKSNSKSGKAYRKIAADLIGEEYKGSWLNKFLKRK
jgi:MinD-like ATPase involved in chromosome partitioning or flagellar assembly